MRSSSLDLFALAARLCVVLALLALPMLTLAEPAQRGDRLVGADVQRTSGAGLVIVVGLKRAR